MTIDGNILPRATLWSKTFYTKKYTIVFLESKYGKQPPFQAVSPYVLFGLMREDTLTRQVFGILLPTEGGYYSECPPGLETLMYDFSLNVGDTINHFCTIPEGCGEVNINSMGEFIMFGISTRWFEVAGGCSWGYLYEGIGSSYGLWEAMFTPVKSQYLSYTFLEYYCPDAVCPFIVVTKELEANDRSLKVYPNPANDKITIEISDTQRPFEMMIYDAKGLCHKSQQFDQSGNGTFQVDISSLPLGIYLLQIQTKSTTYTQKIIKANRATAY